jgi:Uma2 family endonuclease
MAPIAPIPEVKAEDSVVLRLGSALSLSDDQLLELCRLNETLRIERTSEGDLEMAPVGCGSDRRNTDILFQLETWARSDGSGIAFGPSAGFVLPNTAMRAPDAAWVRRSRLSGLSRDQKEKFLPLCPDFVIEVRSLTDRLAKQQRKLKEYMANGAALGFLIDPIERMAYVYRPGEPPQILREPATLSADPVLPNFVLQLEEVWDLSW